MRFKSKLIEFFKREVTFNKSANYYENGLNDEYAERTERLINNSVTAKQCANMLAVFLVGKGFDTHDNFIVGKQTLLELGHKAAYSISRHRGVYFHVQYNMNYEKVSIDVLPYNQCRVGKKDSEQYNGKIGLSEDFSKQNNTVWLDVYDDDKEKVRYQMAGGKKEPTAEQVEQYKGQVLFLNLDYNNIYPLSTIDAVQDDCDSESQSSIYKNRSLRKGFFGKTIVVTRPLVDDFEGTLTDVDIAKKKQQESERDAFIRNQRNFIGADNNGGIMHVEIDHDDAESLDNAIKYIDIAANVDDKLFEYTETSVSDNIMMAFGTPKILIKQSDSGVFGNSGELITQSKLFYQDNTTMERMRLFQTLERLLNGFATFTGVLSQLPLVDVKPDEVGDADVKKAQATLKGSVGGVQGILGIQDSYSQGKTDRESAITILTEIYGFTREVADSLLGKPEEETNNNVN